MTNVERIRAMSDGELADLLDEIAYNKARPWEGPFEGAFCETCPTTECTRPDGKKLNLHECDLNGGECHYDGAVAWWLGQTVEEIAE